MQIWDGASMCLIGYTQDQAGMAVTPRTNQGWGCVFPGKRETCLVVSNSLGLHGLWEEYWPG